MTTEEVSDHITMIPAIPSATNIKDLIFTMRGVQVLLDSDVAMLYGYETKGINKAVSRNLERFPQEFRFQLTVHEAEHLLRFQNGTSKDGTSKDHGGRRYRPFVFTEYGVIALAGVLRNETATQTSIRIIKAFVEMRKLINSNRNVFAKIASIDNKLSEHDRKFDEVFDLLQQPEPVRQSIFFKGQFYDAFKLVVDIIRQAKSTVTIIDNYVDNSVFDLFSNKQQNVKATIITANTSKLSKHCLDKFAAQHGKVQIVANRDFHDRFIILDNKEVYVFGASLKDLGNKCFAVFKIEDSDELVARVSKLIQS